LRRTGRRDKSQVEVKVKVKSEIKAKVKIEENFENFEDDILKKKVEAQVKVKWSSTIHKLFKFHLSELFLETSQKSLNLKRPVIFVVCHQDYLVDLVYVVYFVCLVCLVCSVCLAYCVCKGSCSIFLSLFLHNLEKEDIIWEQFGEISLYPVISCLNNDGQGYS